MKLTIGTTQLVISLVTLAVVAGIAWGMLQNKVAIIETQHTNILDKLLQIQIDIQKLKDAQGIK